VTLATRVLSVVIALLGVAIIVAAIDRADIARGVIGVLFIALGAGRLYLAGKGH
jgi:hypothetical protein